ncbi:MAG: hypothetical protein HY727_15095 [Candidatus Rokubacteria bacterium]|nr:hypothetical protein [Candidatus Rokubacteria bacterium]
MTPKIPRAYPGTVPYDEAVRLVGSEDALRAGTTPQRVWNWKNKGVPWIALGPLIAAKIVAPSPPKPPYLLKGFQEVRSFTCLVEALLKIQERADGPTFSAAWKIMEATAEAIRHLSGWSEADWEKMFRKDHWAKLTKRREAEVIGAALRQEELPL